MHLRLTTPERARASLKEAFLLMAKLIEIVFSPKLHIRMPRQFTPKVPNPHSQMQPSI
jgi:hypothetical protein